MDLRDKFDNYQTEVDVEAWEHFRLLRDNQNSKRRFFWWFLFGGIFVIGVLTFWTLNQHSVEPIKMNGDNTNESKLKSNIKAKQETIIDNEAIVVHSDTEESTTTKNVVSKKSTVDTYNLNDGVIKNKTSVKRVTNQKSSLINKTFENTDYTNSKIGKQKEQLSEIKKNKKQSFKTLEQKKYHQKNL